MFFASVKLVLAPDTSTRHFLLNLSVKLLLSFRPVDLTTTIPLLLVDAHSCQGLNLIPLEYIFARGEPASAGVVLASEFSACSSLLNGAMRINPFDVAKTAGAFAQALTMSEGERSVTFFLGCFFFLSVLVLGYTGF